jgi:hypothetical protein
MRKRFLSKTPVASAPTGERFDLEAPIAVIDDNPPIVVVRDDLTVSSHAPGPSAHEVGSRNIPMTPYGGSLAAVPTTIGDNW